MVCVPKLTDDGVIITRTNRFEGDGSNSSTVSIFGLILSVLWRKNPQKPMWGVNRWVFLGDLFVDINILEQVSSSGKLSQLDHLWQDLADELVLA
ncbi:MAG: hypothetical protein KME38_04755 [Spirirestis rafaelensis WJT71-NPBG6]|nr:hypothetical protein [Spirirestis rafaelensis WJT71-NPBG6]